MVFECVRSLGIEFLGLRFFPRLLLPDLSMSQNKCGASSYHQGEIVVGQGVASSALRTFHTSRAPNLEMKYQNVVCSNRDMKLFLKS